MAVTGTSRWKKLKTEAKDRFWDRRPFTRVVQSYNAYLNLKDYIEINRLEGFGLPKSQARFYFEWNELQNHSGDTG